MGRTTAISGPAALTALAAALLLTGCGGGAAAPPAGPPSPAASAPAAPAPTAAAPVATDGPVAGTGAPPPATTRPPRTPSASPRPAPGPGPGGTRCATARLTAALGPAEGTAGSVHRTLRLTNTGGTACTVTGFPGVSYVAGDDGHQVGRAAAWAGSRGGAVRLAAGATASAALTLLDVGVLDEAACHPVAVRGLRIYPPGSTTALFVPTEGRGCSTDPGRPQLTVAGLRPS